MNYEQLSELARLYAKDDCFRSEILKRVAKLPKEQRETFETMKNLYCILQNSGELKERKKCEQ
jgi:hypothetical protein